MTQLELLEACGVHPPGLNRTLALLGIRAHARSVDEAETLIRSVFSLAADIPAKRRHQAPDQKSHPACSSSLSNVEEENRRGRPPARGISNSVTTTARPLAEARGLSFSYPLGARALDSIDFQVRAGEFVAIVGQNGSGKTTLAKHLVGLLRPAAGRILLAGRDGAALRPGERVDLVGYVFQNPDHQIFAATVEAEVAFGPRNFGVAPMEVERRVSEVLRAVNLESARGRDPFLLSKGERQRLAVASVLALHPQLLILDEPTTGLDYREQRRMMGLVNELNRAGIAIIIITHTPWLVAEYARRVVLMRQGRILFDGAVTDFFEQDELLRESSFRPPEVTALGRRFGLAALSPEQFAATFRQLSGSADHAC